MLEARMTYPTHKERGTDRESAGRGRIAPVIGPVEDPVPTVAAAPAVGGASAKWAVGNVVAGRFVLQERLGRGRYGPIYKALDRSLSEALIGVEHHVALHELHPRIATQPVLLERLENLPFHPHAWSHPNLVKLLEFGRDGAKYFLSEELLEGAPIRLVLDENPWEPLTYDEVLAVLRGVGDALNYAHAKGIVHGDVRPQNVFVTANYNIKLLDLLPGNEPRPTPFFPEEMSNDRQPHPSDDVYGLACLAYELLTRRHPYNGNSPLEAVTAGLTPQPVPGLPLPQWQALSRGLALRRERRTAGVPELLAGLGVTGTEILRRGKDARPKPAEAAPPAAVPREAEPEAWPEVTVPPMDARHRGAAVAAAAPAVIVARAPRLEEPSFAKLAFDAETPTSTRPRARRRSSPVRMVLGTAVVAALAFVAYRDHAQLVIQAADLIETSAAFATEEIAQWQARSASPTRRETSTNAARRRAEHSTGAERGPDSCSTGGVDSCRAVSGHCCCTASDRGCWRSGPGDRGRDRCAEHRRGGRRRAPCRASGAAPGCCNTHFRAAAVRLCPADTDGDRGGAKRTHRDPKDRIAGRGRQRGLVDCRPYGIGR